MAYAGFCYAGRTDKEGREGGRKILWQMAQHANGPRWISNAPGYNTIAAYLPSADATLVILTNSNVPNDGSGPAEQLAGGLSGRGGLLGPGRARARLGQAHRQSWLKE